MYFLVVLLALYVIAGLVVFSSGRTIQDEERTKQGGYQQVSVPTDDVQPLKFNELAAFELGVVLVFVLLLGFVMVFNYGNGLLFNVFMVVATLAVVYMLIWVMQQKFNSTKVESLPVTVYSGGLYLLAALNVFQFGLRDRLVGPRLCVAFFMFIVVLMGVFLVAKVKNAADNLRRFLIYFQLGFFGVGLAIAMVSLGTLTVPVLILSQIILAMSAIYLTSS